MTSRSIFLAVLVGVVSASFATASEGAPAEAHGLFTASFGYAVINFLLLVGILYTLLRKPVREFLLSRRDDLQKAIAEATEAKTKAEAALAQYRGKLANIESELQQLRVEIVGAAEREREKIIEEAKVQAAKIVADAKWVGEQEVERAKHQLRAEVAALAADLAAKSVARDAAPADRERQIEEFIASLEKLS